MLAVRVTVGTFVFIHVHGADSEIVVPVVGVLGRDCTQEVFHIFDQEWFVFVYFDRRSCVAREDDRNSGFDLGFPHDIDNEIRDVDELWCSSRSHVEALCERPQYVTSPS